jgi:hypothetical protein
VDPRVEEGSGARRRDDNVSGNHLPILKRTLLAAFTALALAGRAAADPSPALFYYPPAAIYPPHYLVGSPLTLLPGQSTTQFPAIPEMNGVAFTTYWSVICPQEGKYDFSMIDDALSYWRARGKKVVLAVATVGFPVRMADDSLMSATPAWVMKKVANVTAKIRIIPYSPILSKNRGVASVPSYFDPVFMAETRKLVNALAQRYDGNPTIAQVRICTGILGEDNATFDGIQTKYPGFTKDGWTDYTREVTDLYCAAFHHSELDWDEGWITVNQMYGTAEEKARARAYVESLFQRHIFIAFNGLSSQDNFIWQNRDNPAALTQWQQTIALDLRTLQEAKRHGCHIGLEAYSVLTDKEMRSVPDMLATIRALQPDRLVWFNDVAQLRKFSEAHPTLPAAGLPGYPPALLPLMVQNANELFKGLGYP